MANVDDYIVRYSAIYFSRWLTRDFFFVINDTEIPLNRGMITEEVSCYLFHLIRKAAEEDLNRVPLEYVNVLTFELILAHLYECQLDFERMNFGVLLPLMETAHVYDLPALVRLAAQQIRFYLNYDNILRITIMASNFDLTRLIKICRKFMAANARELLTREQTFDRFLLSLTKEQLIHVLNEMGGRLYVEELDVFNAVNRWAERHALSGRERRELLTRCVRLELFTAQQFDAVVLPTGWFRIEQYDEAILNGDGRQRCRRIVDTNFANPNNAGVHGGHNADQLIDGRSFDAQRRYNRITEFAHIRNGAHISDPLVIDLGAIRLVNNINLHLYDDIVAIDSLRYSFGYYVETSTDRHANYYRVVDHSNFMCRSLQRIYFYPREVRYIRIVGVNTYVDFNRDELHSENCTYFRSLTCQLTDYPFDISRGLWTPDRRITTIESGCSLPFGDNEPHVEWEGNIAWMLRAAKADTHYSYHNRRRKYTLTHLPQPIYAFSIRLQTLNSGTFNYKISTSERNVTDFGAVDEKDSTDNSLIEINVNHEKLINFVKIQGRVETSDRFKCFDLQIPNTV